MNYNPTEPIKAHWNSVQGKTSFEQSNLIELVRFLARRAAERDHQAENVNGKGDNDT